MPNFVARLKRAVLGPDRAARETAYLDGSTSIFDLERRQREIDAGAFAPRRLGY